MSIETTLTLVIAAALLVGALLVRTLALGLIKAFVMIREWVRPAGRHRAPTQRVITLAIPVAVRAPVDERTLADVPVASRRP